MKPILFFLLYFFCVVVAKAADTFVTFAPTNGAQLKLTGQSDTILYDPADWKGVEIAVKNLRQDLRAVTGSECAPIVVGTVGKSRCVKKYKKIVDHFNQFLGDTEKVKRFDLIGYEWSVATGELTPTLKLKRNMLMKKYEEQIEKLFS